MVGRYVGREMGEKGKWRGLCTKERSRTEGAKAVRNRLFGVYAATWGHVISRPVLPQSAMPGSVALLQLGAVPKPVAHFTINCKDAQGLGHHLSPCRCQRTVLPLGLSRSEWPALPPPPPPKTMVTTRPKMWPKAVSESVVLL